MDEQDAPRGAAIPDAPFLFRTGALVTLLLLSLVLIGDGGIGAASAGEQFWAGGGSGSPRHGWQFFACGPALACAALILAFRWRGQAPRGVLNPVRGLSVFLLFGVGLDAGLGVMAGLRAPSAVTGDWRYEIRSRIVTGIREGNTPPQPSGTPLDHVGPFQPNLRTDLGRVSFNTDADGYRREIGPWPTCHAPDAAPDCREQTVLCVGGSTTEGLTVEPDDLPWPDVMEGLLAVQLPERRVRVVNGGRSGVNAGGALGAVARHFEYAEPAHVVVYYGGVNTVPPSILGRAIPRVSFIASALDRLRTVQRGAYAVGRYDGLLFETPLRHMAALLRETGGAFVLATFPLPFSAESPAAELAYWDGLVPWQSSARTLARLVEIHNGVMRRVATEEGARLVDAAGALGMRPELFVDDEHFVQAGRNALAALIAPVVAEALREQRVPNG